MCLCQHIVIDQTSSHCVAVSRLSSGLRSSIGEIRNLKMSSAFMVQPLHSYVVSLVKIKQSTLAYCQVCVGFVQLNLFVCTVYEKTMNMWCF